MREHGLLFLVMQHYGGSPGCDHGLERRRDGWETEIHSVAAAIQNMLLKAYELGLGTLWIGDIFYALKALKQHFGKPWKLTAAVALGWPARIPEPCPRKSVDEVTEFFS